MFGTEQNYKNVRETWIWIEDNKRQERQYMMR